jgi:hypothetical protein
MRGERPRGGTYGWPRELRMGAMLARAELDGSTDYVRGLPIVGPVISLPASTLS